MNIVPRWDIYRCSKSHVHRYPNSGQLSQIISAITLYHPWTRNRGQYGSERAIPTKCNWQYYHYFNFQLSVKFLTNIGPNRQVQNKQCIPRSDCSKRTRHGSKAVWDANNTDIDPHLRHILVMKIFLSPMFLFH